MRLSNPISDQLQPVGLISHRLATIHMWHPDGRQTENNRAMDAVQCTA